MDIISKIEEDYDHYMKLCKRFGGNMTDIKDTKWRKEYVSLIHLEDLHEYDKLTNDKNGE